MVSLIKGMTVANGFNFDWATVNEIDKAIGDFPRAVIDSPIESNKGAELNMDQLNGQHSDAYTNEAIFTIQISGQLPTVADQNAYFAIRDTLRRSLDDLKQLFGKNNTANDTCDVILYRDAVIQYIQRNDLAATRITSCRTKSALFSILCKLIAFLAK